MNGSPQPFRVFGKQIDMAKARNNYAFIDSQNLNLSIREQGWALHFRKFRQYLRDK